uniref:Uncharacterized protein n=1 Tax=Mustela putorius furo TaxID=9669 RepID=M3YIC0_MUSPF
PSRAGTEESTAPGSCTLCLRVAQTSPPQAKLWVTGSPSSGSSNPSKSDGGNKERGERQALQPPGSRQPSPRACDRRWISSTNHGHAHAGTGPQGTGEGAPARHLLWGIYF